MGVGGGVGGGGALEAVGGGEGEGGGVERICALPPYRCGIFAGEVVAEFGDGAGEAFSCGGFGDVEGVGDVVDGAVLIEAEEDGGAIGGGEFCDGGVEGVGEEGGFGGIGGLGGVELRGELLGDLLFVFLAGAVGAAEVAEGVVEGIEEPAGEVAFLGIGHGVGLLCEEEEDGLCGVFGEMAVVELAEGGGEEPGGVAVGEGAEGGFGTRGGEVVEEVGVGWGVLVSLVHGFGFLTNSMCVGGGLGQGKDFVGGGRRMACGPSWAGCPCHEAGRRWHGLGVEWAGAWTGGL